MLEVFDDTIDGLKQDVQDVVSWFSDKVLYDLMEFEAGDLEMYESLKDWAQ